MLTTLFCIKCCLCTEKLLVFLTDQRLIRGKNFCPIVTELSWAKSSWASMKRRSLGGGALFCLKLKLTLELQVRSVRASELSFQFIQSDRFGWRQRRLDPPTWYWSRLISLKPRGSTIDWQESLTEEEIKLNPNATSPALPTCKFVLPSLALTTCERSVVIEQTNKRTNNGWTSRVVMRGNIV